MKGKTLKCPGCGAEMPLEEKLTHVTFRGDEFDVAISQHICPKCGMEAATPKQAGVIQKTIADAYREKAGLLTSSQIREQREKLGLTQEALAEQTKIGIASIKRWESGLVQTASMDDKLRSFFNKSDLEFELGGKRILSLSRIKLVLRYLEKQLSRNLIKKNDKFLFTAKYAWYADMVSFRELGRSMTGATYACLPYGPQLDNYRDLLDIIKDADESTAEPLSEEETRILERIAKTFPANQSVMDAAHREPVWKNRVNGQKIPYASAAELTEI